MKNKTEWLQKAGRVVIPVVFWIGLWWILSAVVGKEWVLPSPKLVAETLISFAKTKSFWTSAALSTGNILSGYLAGIASGVLLAVLCEKFTPVKMLFAPLLGVLRSTPVASFIMLLWVFVNRSAVPFLIVLFIVMPIVFGNMSEGLSKTDRELLEVAEVYDFSFFKKLRAIYVPQLLPFFSSAAVTGLGLAWKSGIAAEVLCAPLGSIGRSIFMAKRDVETAELFAYTAVVIALCFGFEALVRLLLRGARKKRTAK